MQFIGANPNAPELVVINGAIATLADKIADHAVRSDNNFAKYKEADDTCRKMHAKVWGVLQNLCGRLDVTMDEDSFDRTANALVEAAFTAARHRHEYSLLLTDLNLYEVKDFDVQRRRARELRQFMDAKPTLDRHIASLEGDLRLERDRADGLQAEVDRLTAELTKCKDAPAASEDEPAEPAAASAANGGWNPTPEDEPFQVALRVNGSSVEMQVLEQPEESRGLNLLGATPLASIAEIELRSVTNPALGGATVYLRGDRTAADKHVCSMHCGTHDQAVKYAANVRALIAHANAEWKAKKQAEADAKTGGATP